MRINPQCRFQNPRLFWTRLYNYMWRVTVRKQESYENNVSGANASYMLKTTLKRILCNSLRVEIEIMQSNFLTETSRTPDKTVETFPQPPPQALRFSHDRGERETRVTGDEAQETIGRLLPTFHIERETSGHEADISMYLSISCYETIPSKRNKVAPSPLSVQRSCFGLTAHAYISGVRLVTVNNVGIGEGENGLSICYGKHFCQDQCKKYVFL